MTAYIVSGTQAPLGQNNHVIVMKMSELHHTENEDAGNDGWQINKWINELNRWINA